MSEKPTSNGVTCDNCGDDCGFSPYEVTVDLDGHEAVIGELCYSCAESLATGEGLEIDFTDV